MLADRRCNILQVTALLRLVTTYGCPGAAVTSEGVYDLGSA